MTGETLAKELMVTSYIFKTTVGTNLGEFYVNAIYFNKIEIMQVFKWEKKRLRYKLNELSYYCVGNN